MRVRWFVSLTVTLAVVAMAVGGEVPAGAADDTTPPTLFSVTPPIPPFPVPLWAYYRQNAVVLADYTCNDETGGSGLASCTGTVPDGSPIDTSTLGLHSFEIDAQDNAGNATTLSFAYQVASPAKVSITSATVVENDVGQQAVKLSVESSGGAVPFSLGFHTQAGSADSSDYSSRSGTLSFYTVRRTKGGTSIVLKPKQAIIVPLRPDTNIDGDKSFNVVLATISDPNTPVDIVDGTGTVTILDDDVTAGPRVSVSDVIAREGRTMYFVVALATPAATTITVPYSVTGDTATGGPATLTGGDFVAKKPGTLKFSIGQRFKYIAVAGRYDTTAELDETMHVTLGTPSGAIAYRATGTGTILDDD